MDLATAWPVLAVAVLFTYVNGFHDAPNAIATAVSTRALTPRAAVALAAAGNLLGAGLGVGIARVVASGLVDADGSAVALRVGTSTFVAALAWSLFTWWRGMPSSSTHALLCGLVGAALAAGIEVHWGVVGERVLLPLVVSPALGLLGGLLLLRFVRHRLADRDAAATAARLRDAQTVSAGMVAIGHGMQDAAKPAGVLALAIAGSDQADVPAWTLVLTAVVLAAGTYAGGWRIMRTLGERLVDLDTSAGFAAESTTAVVLAGATAVGSPVSSTHTLAAAIVGTGLARNPRAIRWRVARSVALTWLATPLVTGALAAVVCVALSRTGR